MQGSRSMVAQRGRFLSAIYNIAEYRLTTTTVGLLACFALLAGSGSDAQPSRTWPPVTLAETALYSNFERRQIAPQNFAFSPQYPLWTDGAIKRRWIWLPPETSIDASDPEAWKFPEGTRFWKEFSFHGQRVETRFMELQPSGQWRYAAYHWRADGRSAQLVSEKGKPNAHPLTDRRSHSIPSVADCKACHQGGRSEVLGFSTLQLSPQRDPNALHVDLRDRSTIDLEWLVRKGLLVGLPTSVIKIPPRIQSSSPTERSALGYLHGNCGHCHNAEGPLKNLGLFLRHTVNAENSAVIASTVGRAIKKRAPGQSTVATLRIDPDHPERSALLQRIASRYAALQMPPLGTELVDEEAVSLLRRWISELNSPLSTQRKEDQ